MTISKLILVFVVLFLASFSSAFAQSNEPIRVGLLLDMSGQTGSFGISTYSGVKQAVDEINAMGGVDGRKIELIIEDTQSNPEKAKLAAQKFVAENKVDVLIGGVSSATALAAAPIAQAAKIPMITPSATNPKITEVGDYIFRTCFIDSFQGEAMAKFAFETLRARRIAVLSDSTSTYSKDLAHKFTSSFMRIGGRIVTEKTYTQMDEDYFQQLKGIKNTKPDAIYIPGYYGQIGAIAQHARQMKINIPLLGGDGWDAPDLWQIDDDSLNNSYITNHFSPENPAENVKKFTADYKRLFGLEADATAALGYDTIYLIVEAIQRAKSTESLRLRDSIAATKDFNGITGKISLNSKRNAIKPAIILKLQNPNFIYHSTIQP